MFQNRRQTVMIAVLGFAIVAFLGMKVLGGGGGGSTPAADAPGVSTPSGSPGSHKTTASTTTTTVPETFNVFATKDPFESPIPDIPPTTVPNLSALLTAPTTTAPPSTPTTTTPSLNPNPTVTVSLLDVFVPSDGVTRARVQVSTTVYTVQSGDAFAKSFRVVSLDNKSGCGQFLFGDSPFQLCKGDQVVK
jgi:hypothetical protein